ncbi:RNA polymerase-associated protein CTR9 [Trypanosoma rangeli]|uniref:RNA polymerase-associated protein CTR9 n=1 Tax=Trypanosoma rangeli TaxID=5698 RepID=A0A3R7MIY5_TRYRA|nr:RNA polymerase-associated protein CTR9 [Trypanosoma rangeli]RNF03346.1 RNA polymerase-associated protein CTR9 [Trypanosoma rangeli]|eukprot:RNF03346.1 RNA polymerase-associated protein CTR9 [Trypanosoma rangeli]
MLAYSQRTQATLDDAHDAFSRGEIEHAKSILDSVDISEAHSREELHDLFAIRCVRASIAAMGGERTVASIMSDTMSHSLHRPVALYLEGLAAMASGTNLQTARVKFEEAFRADGHFVLARLGLAAVSYHMKRYKKSFSHYRALLETLGSACPPIVRVGMGLCAYHLSHLDYAQRCLERALEVNKDDELALLALLVVFLDRCQIPKVIEVAQRLRHLLPGNAMVLLKVADLVYFRAVTQKRVKAAAGSIRRLLAEVRRVATVEESATADYQEGRLCLALDDLSNARLLLESAMQVLPNLMAARIHYARALLLSGRETEAEHLLLRVNRDNPNQKEVLQLLAAYASRHGLHEKALEYSGRLTEIVAPGDIRSWSLASWCARLNKEDTKKLMSHLARIQQEVGESVSMQLLANIASIGGDTDALQRILDRELGADFLSQPNLPVVYVPLVFNLALLLEETDRTRARQLYIYLVKQHGYFQPPYIRLHVLAKADGFVRQAVAWLVLLQQIVPEDPTSLASIAELFFTQSRATAAMAALRSARGRPLPVALAFGAVFLWCSQQHGKDNRRFLASAKDRFTFVLRRDNGNVLAAHGLACCLGLEADYDRCQCLLDRVGEVRPNCDYVRRHHEAHMANVKTLNDSFKQAIDYLERDPKRTPLQTSSLAFCLACENRYEEAVAVLNAVVAENPNLPLLQYNLSLLYCAAFVHAIARKEAITPEKARDLRQSLATGLSIAFEFVRQEPRSQAMAVAKTFLKTACAYCLNLNDHNIGRLIVAGQRDSAEYARQSKLWQRVYSEFQKEKQHEVEQRQAEQRQRQEQELQVAREILDDFRRSQLDQVTILDEETRTRLEAYRAEFGSAVPPFANDAAGDVVRSVDPSGNTSTAILGGMNLEEDDMAWVEPAGVEKELEGKLGGADASA